MVFSIDGGSAFGRDWRSGTPSADEGCVLIASIDDESDQVPKGCPVDALALRGDEGRGTLR